MCATTRSECRSHTECTPTAQARQECPWPSSLNPALHVSHTRSLCDHLHEKYCPPITIVMAARTRTRPGQRLKACRPQKGAEVWREGPTQSPDIPGAGVQLKLAIVEHALGLSLGGWRRRGGRGRGRGRGTPHGLRPRRGGGPGEQARTHIAGAPSDLVFLQSFGTIH
jgi:hypothetical protein